MKNENKIVLAIFIFATIVSVVITVANPEIPIPVGIEFETMSARNLSNAFLGLK